MKDVAEKLLVIAKEILANRDYDEVLKRVRKVLSGFSYTEKTLGKLDDGEMKIFVPKNAGNKKRVLFIAGMHGEEPGGVWGVVSFLENHSELLKDVAVTVVPVVNVHGFVSGERLGETGAHTNWFLTEDRQWKDMGKEARILKDNLELLGWAARDGLVDAHEDATSEGFYLYILGDIKCKTVVEMKKTGLKFFDFKRDNHYSDNGEYDLVDGIVDNYKDGSFDDAMVMKFGIPLAITIETPTRGADVEKRAKACGDMTAVFVKGIRDEEI